MKRFVRRARVGRNTYVHVSAKQDSRVRRSQRIHQARRRRFVGERILELFEETNFSNVNLSSSSSGSLPELLPAKVKDCGVISPLLMAWLTLKAPMKGVGNAADESYSTSALTSSALRFSDRPRMSAARCAASVKVGDMSSDDGSWLLWKKELMSCNVLTRSPSDCGSDGSVSRDDSE